MILPPICPFHRSTDFQTIPLDELECAQSIVNILLEQSPIYPARSTLKDLAEHLKLGIADLKRFRKELGALVDNPTSLIDRLDDDTIDRILDKADRLGLEIFDRTGLPEGLVDQRRVAYLRAARSSARLAIDVRTFGGKLLDIGACLQQDAGQLQVYLNEVDNIYGKYQALTEKLATKGVQPAINELDIQLQRFEQALGQLKHIDTHWDATEKRMINLRARVEGFTKTVGEADKVIEVVQQKANKAELIRHSIDIKAKALYETNQVVRRELQNSLSMLTAAGLQAVRILNLEDATKYHRVVYQNNSNQLIPGFELLSDSVSWLNTLYHQYNTVYQRVREWRQCILENDIETAQEAYISLGNALKRSPEYVTELFSNWVISELWGAFQAMLSPRQEGDITSHPVSSINPTELTEQNHIQSHFQQLETFKLEKDIPENLEQLDKLLASLKDRRHLSAEYLINLQVWLDGYKRRKEISETAARWYSFHKQCRHQSPISVLEQRNPRELSELLIQTNAILALSSKNIPEAYWDELYRNLEQVYEHVKRVYNDGSKLNQVLEDRFLWMGMLYFRAQHLSSTKRK